MLEKIKNLFVNKFYYSYEIIEYLTVYLHSEFCPNKILIRVAEYARINQIINNTARKSFGHGSIQKSMNINQLYDLGTQYEWEMKVCQEISDNRRVQRMIYKNGLLP